VKGSCTNPMISEGESARTCGMEAWSVNTIPNESEPLRRPVSLGEHASKCEAQYPDEGARYWGRRWCEEAVFYPGRSPSVRVGGRVSRQAGPMYSEKSDHPIVAAKPGNAGGVKGVTT